MFKTSQVFLHVLIIYASLLATSVISTLPLEPIHVHQEPVTITPNALPQNPITPLPHAPLVPHHRGRKYIPDGPALEFLEAHNRIRAQYGEPPLKWSRRLARYAHRHGRTLTTNCTGIHSYGPYGENLFWATRKYWAPARIVDDWASESKDYDAKTLNCTAGPRECGHFTQIVWFDSRRVGCQVLPCLGQGVIGICNYEPRGNYVNRSPFVSMFKNHRSAGIVNKILGKPQPAMKAGGVPTTPATPHLGASAAVAVIARLRHALGSKTFGTPPAN
ncbi:hypothetical protein Drorol1_Dr00026142 [Drosera rotundifolia]